MNGDHQSLAAAPLDLRTTNRERGTPICKGRVRDALPLAESGASRKRPTDKPSSRLPFRKRPIHVEPDAPTQPATSEPCGHRVPPAEEPIIQQSFAGQSEAENRLVPASVIPKRKAEDGRRNPAEYPVRCLNPTDYVQTVFYGKLFNTSKKKNILKQFYSILLTLHRKSCCVDYPKTFKSTQENVNVSPLVL